MSVRRFTRLTNAFSKRWRTICHALTLCLVHYNFCRVHESLGKTPAMAAGLTDRPIGPRGLVELIDLRARACGPRGPYKPRISN